MEPHENELPEGLGYLPAFVRAQVESPDAVERDFVRWLLQAFEVNLHWTEWMAANSQMLFDPEDVADLPWEAGAPGLSGCALGDWLHWLAGWVALDLDQEWLAEPARDGGARPHAAANADPNPRCAKARALIQKAAELYRERGTARGLVRTAKELYDWDVEVLERSWPQGMAIGVSSSIGVNSRLVDRPDFDFQFVVLIRPDTPGRARLLEAGERLPSELMGLAAGRRVEWLFGPREQESDPSLERRAAAVNQLRRLLDREIPAHTRYYLACEAPGQPILAERRMEKPSTG